MKKTILCAILFATMISLESCDGGSKPASETKTYEQTVNSSNVTVEDTHINNRLSTGEIPYSCKNISGDESTITIKTGTDAECDVVVIVKSGDTMVDNAYIVSGDSYTFNLPNGYYQVFFYGGKGWNPDKVMPNGDNGGFVASESFSKDEPVNLYNQELEYELILRQNGNFSTEPSSANEVF